MKRVLQALLVLVLVGVIGFVVWNDWFRSAPSPTVPPPPMRQAVVEREIVGIGAVLKTDEDTDTLRIVDVLPNSPAAKAGIVPGTIIRSIDGQATEGIGLGDCVRLIRGPAGSKLRLEVVDLHQNLTNTIELIRARIELPPDV
jgi:C-terminal processing protease CtpA/Prc